MKNIFIKLILIFPAILIFSCRSADLMKRRYSAGFYLSHSGKPVLPKSVEVKNHTNHSSVAHHSVASPGLLSVASAHEKTEKPVLSQAYLHEPMVSNAHSSVMTNITQRSANNNLSASTSTENLKTANDFSGRVSPKTESAKPPPLDEEGMFILLLILSLIVPPLAIYLKNKKFNRWFWISLICCLLAGGIFFNAGVLGTAWIAAFLIALLYVLEVIS